jgi:hypothetical protein
MERYSTARTGPGGGGAYQRWSSSGEVVREVGEALTNTPVVGWRPVMAGVVRSTSPGGRSSSAGMSWLVAVGRVRFLQWKSFSDDGETFPQGYLTRDGCGRGSTLTGITLALARVNSGFWWGRALVGVLECSRELRWMGWALVGVACIRVHRFTVTEPWQQWRRRCSCSRWVFVEQVTKQWGEGWAWDGAAIIGTSARATLRFPALVRGRSSALVGACGAAADKLCRSNQGSNGLASGVLSFANAHRSWIWPNLGKISLCDLLPSLSSVERCRTQRVSCQGR